MAGLKINICFWYLDSTIVEEIIGILEDGNYDPSHCLSRDRNKVKAKIDNGSIDLIIADFDLPDALRKTIEQIHRNSTEEVPLIYIVGEKNELKAAETLKRGVWDYVLKHQFTKLVSTVYSSQKYGKVIRHSKIVKQEKQKLDEISSFLVQYISDPIIILDEDWNVLFANSRARGRLEISGAEQDEILLALQNSIVDQSGNPHPEITKILRKEIEITNQQEYVGFIMPDGSVAYGFMQLQKVNSQEYGENLTIITFRDTTELRKVEKELSESESKYLSIFNAVQDGMLLIETDSLDIIENNPRLEEMFGFDSKKSRQDNLLEFYKQENGYDKESLRKVVKGLSDSDPVNFIYLSRTLKGDGFWTENTLTQFAIGEKSLIVLVIRDINEQKLMEYNLKESKEHFQNLAENSPDVIMRFDKMNRHLYVNQTVESQVGIKSENFINKTHAEMGVFPEDKVKIWEDALDTSFNTGKPQVLEFTFETEKALLYYEWRIFPERSDSGEIETVLAIARDTTASKTADISIKVNEERLQLALDAASMGLWDWNLLTDDVYFSPIWMSMLGYGPNELEPNVSTWQDLLHENDREKSLSHVNTSIEDRDEGFEMEFRMLCKDGGYKWILAKGRAVQFDDEGNTIRLAGTHEDIDERKRNENIQSTLFHISNAVNTTKNLQELYEKIQEYLNLVVDTTNCFLAIFHEETNTLTLPFLRDEKDSFTEFPAGKSLTGYVIKTGVTQLVDSKKEEELTRLGEIEPVGTPCVSWLGVPLKVNDIIIGVYVIQSYSKDVVYTKEDVSILEFVSDQIALAIERKRDQDRIRENQAKQRRIFESSPDPIIVVDLNALIIDYNSALIDELSITSEQIVGQNVFHFLHKKYWRKAIVNFEATWTEGYIKNLEFLIHRANGSTFEGTVATGAMYNNDGEPESMVIMIKNIEERKEIERNLVEAKEKAEEADRLKTAFLSNMSHEIRTPMNAIVGFSDLLSDPSVKDEDKTEFIAQINLGADNLMHLIDDIIDISKIEAGQIKVRKGECDIKELVQEQIIMFRQNLGRLDKAHLNLTLTWDWPSDSLIINTDPFRLKQIISNLLSNAIKFTDEGKVELGIEKKQDDVYFYVKDTGIGILDEKQSIIFDRFRQGHDSNIKLYGGTGLGLAISRNIAYLLGGGIGVNSNFGEGSEFWFTIPAVETPAKKQKERQRPEQISKDFRGKKILVAEDDFSNYLLISEALKSTNAEIIWAKDGQETLELFNKKADEIHLVLMDIHMPIINGYDCTKAIKEEKPDLPVIAQTAYAMSGEREMSFDAGCDDYISKPIQIDHLIKMIGQYMK
jgi:PAS domain S-box-containing protein